MIAWIFAVLVGMLVPWTPATAGERFLAEPKLATDCQSALLAATTPFAQKKLKQLDKCAMAAFKCLQTVAPNDDAEIDPIDACLEKASLRCAKAVEVIAAEEQRLTDTIVSACSALHPLELLRADGVGFEQLAVDCLDLGITLTDVASVAQCVVLQHECAVEQMYRTEHPRAGELFSLVAADLGPDSCLDDFAGPGEGVGDVKLGRQLAQCEQSVTKAGATFIGSKLKNVGRCLDAIFRCVQLSAHDGGKCLGKARKTCDGSFAGVAGGALALQPTVTKSCGPLPFDTLAAENGIQYQALIDEETCNAFGLSGLATVPHYAICLYRQHECAGDDILRFSAPRAVELLALVDRTLPGSFFCVPPEEF